MSDLFHPAWYRVAKLRPRLPAHVEMHRHQYRGQTWYVLENPVSGRHHRVNRAAYIFVGFMDGARSVQVIWDLLSEKLRDDAPTQGEIMQLLAQLHAGDLLRCNVTPDVQELFERQHKKQQQNWKQRFMNPLALRFPLLDPDLFLQRWLSLARPCFSVFGMLVWSALVAAGVVLAGLHWPELKAHALTNSLAPHNLLLLWLTYPLVKALHELGHGFATKLWGGEVHEMGITLMVLMPVPYVDASAASSFPQRHRRALVGAAGIMTELALAAAATLLWVTVEPGIVRDVAFNVMLIGSVSTVFFNGNPLLRFDGYHVLADVLEIPNLGNRANQYLGYLLQRYLFAVRGVVNPASAGGEAAWFVLYALSSFVYRMTILFLIALFIAGKSLVLGFVVAVWISVLTLLLPLKRMLAVLLTSPLLATQRRRAVMVSLALVAGLIGLVTLIPVPSSTSAQGVVWLPEHSQLRAGADGMVSRLLSRSGTKVEAGDPLLELDDPFLAAEQKILAARLAEMHAAHAAAMTKDKVEARLIADELEATEAALQRLRERSAELIVHSHSAGHFVLPRAADLPGRFLRQGDPVGYVIHPDEIIVRIVVDQDQAGMVRERTERVALRLATELSTPLPGEILREVPAASDRLPSAALGTDGGGPFAVDPEDPQRTRTLGSVFQFDIALPAGVPADAIGQRVYARFDHPAEPMAVQWYRRLRQLFLSRLTV